jgi:hypothetical protein
MADALPVSQPVAETIIAIDVDRIQIDPPIVTAPARPDGRVYYRLRLTWSSGRTELREGNVSAADFATNTAAFLQAAAKKKFLQSLVALGYEPNLNPQ